MKFAGAALAALLLAAPAAQAGSRPVDCQLTVKGKIYIEGVCEFTPRDGGSFQIAGGDYFAQVDVQADGTGEANWNAQPDSTHAQAYLGTVTRKGACWSNRDVTICARALPPGMTRAMLAKQPDGEMIYSPYVPGACIGVEGTLQEGATPVMHNCKVPADLIFVRRTDGSLAIDKHPDLCIDVEAPGMMKPPQLVLAACTAHPRKWRMIPVKGAVSNSAIIRSDDGLCWDVSDLNDDKARFPFAVNTPKCAKRGKESSLFLMDKG